MEVGFLIVYPINDTWRRIILNKKKYVHENKTLFSINGSSSAIRWY